MVMVDRRLVFVVGLLVDVGAGEDLSIDRQTDTWWPSFRYRQTEHMVCHRRRHLAAAGQPGLL